MIGVRLAMALADGGRRVWWAVTALLESSNRVGPLRRLHDRVGRLPPGVALPLFLVPEAASRSGWLASAWLLMHGAGWQALAVYILTKLFAGLTALWIYRACHPALLRVPWFARLHAAALRVRRAILPLRTGRVP